MNEEEKSFIELLHERQPVIFYLTLIAIVSMLIFYFLLRYYFFGVFSIQENAKIIFYIVLQFSSIYYQYYQAFDHNDILQLSALIFPFFLFQFSLCAYIKLEAIISKYDRNSNDSNKKIIRLIVCIIFTFGFIECYIYIINDKLNMKSQEKAAFFIYDNSCLSLVKPPIILALFHAQAINLFTTLNYIAFIINIQIKTDSLFTININWFLNSLHELFQAFLAIYLSKKILYAIPDFIFHASFAIFYFLKQETFATLVQYIKEFFLIFWDDDDRYKIREEDNQNNKDINEEIINNDNSIVSDYNLVENDNNNIIINNQNEVTDNNENNKSNEKIENNKDFQKNETENDNNEACNSKDKCIYEEDPNAFLDDIEAANDKGNIYSSEDHKT